MRRNPQLDLLRIVFATLVLLAHAPEITDGNGSRELLSRWTHTGFSFGAFSVDGFFLLSGYLIVQSWVNDPDWFGFLRKRVVRIVPGYVVAVLLSTVVAGAVAPGAPQFFRHLTMHLPATMLLLTTPATPPVYPGIPAMNLNASLWTIAYEFRCYVLVLVLGLLGAVRRRAVWLLLTGTVVASLGSVLIRPYGPHAFYLVTGQPTQALRLSAAFCVGAVFYLYRDRIVFRPRYAALAGLGLAASLAWPLFFEIGLMLCGGYLMFTLGALRPGWLGWMRHVPDISYGVYLYGYPVEALWIWHFRGSPWWAFAGSVPICFALGWLSWHLVERPMLRFKRGSGDPPGPARMPQAGFIAVAGGGIPQGGTLGVR